jgi:uncharacterized SAM-binding protein YcdF (DUF218 family)
MSDQAPRVPARGRRSLRISLIALALLSCTAYFASTEAGSDLLLVPMHRPYMPFQSERRGEEAIILLTGSHPGRIPTAAALQRSTGLPLIVAGRKAGYYFKKLREAGAQSLWPESNSTNTEQNAAYTACVLAAKGIRVAYIVTDSAHMPRALAWFRYYGLKVTPMVSGPPWPGYSPHPLLPSMIGWKRSTAVVHEWFGLVDYALKAAVHRRLACPPQVGPEQA